MPMPRDPRWLVGLRAMCCGALLGCALSGMMGAGLDLQVLVASLGAVLAGPTVI